MKVKVTVFFEDRDLKGRYYQPGEIVEFDNWRAHDLIARNLAVELKEEKEKKK